MMSRITLNLRKNMARPYPTYSESLGSGMKEYINMPDLHAPRKAHTVTTHWHGFGKGINMV